MESAETKTIEVVVNGDPRRVPQGLSLDGLIAWLGGQPHVGASAKRAAGVKGDVESVGDFIRELKTPAILMGFGLPDDNLHAPNEFLRIRRIGEGLRAWERLWELFASGPHALPTRESGHVVPSGGAS